MLYYRTCNEKYKKTDGLLDQTITTSDLNLSVEKSYIDFKDFWLKKFLWQTILGGCYWGYANCHWWLCSPIFSARRNTERNTYFCFEILVVTTQGCVVNHDFLSLKLIKWIFQRLSRKKRMLEVTQKLMRLLSCRLTNSIESVLSLLRMLFLEIVCQTFSIFSSPLVKD